MVLTGLLVVAEVAALPVRRRRSVVVVGGRRRL